MRYNAVSLGKYFFFYKSGRWEMKAFLSFEISGTDYCPRRTKSAAPPFGRDGLEGG
jgi:hypothetical protein